MEGAKMLAMQPARYSIRSGEGGARSDEVLADMLLDALLTLT